VVRKTGGLADTIFEGQNGFVFEKQEPMAFVAAVTRAVNAYRKGTAWRALSHHGITGRYDWTQSAAKYMDLYEDAISDRISLEELTA
jgi:starch synthase